MFAWTYDAPTYYMDTDGEVITLFADGIEQAKKISYNDLVFADVNTVGAWFYDVDLHRLYVRARYTQDARELFYVGVVIFRFSDNYVESDGDLYVGRITQPPQISIKTSALFDGKFAKSGAGAVSTHNIDAFLVRKDIEPDGTMKIESYYEVAQT
jgi:hypothetical protein